MEKVSVDRIMCIDPGSDTLGVALVEYQVDNPLKIVYAHTHRASSIIRDDKYEESRLRYGELLTRLYAQKNNLIRLVRMLQPDYLAIESPFFNPRNPNSAAVLMYVKQMLNEFAMDDEVALDITWISPQQMKSLIGAKLVKNEDNAAKNIVKDTILKLEEEGKLVCDDDIVLSKLDEHSIDSIGVGYAYVQLLNKKETK